MARLPFTSGTTNPSVGGAVPAGGTTGQLLAKTSNTDFATQWVTGSSGGGSGDVTTYGDNTFTGINNFGVGTFDPSDATFSDLPTLRLAEGAYVMVAGDETGEAGVISNSGGSLVLESALGTNYNVGQGIMYGLPGGTLSLATQAFSGDWKSDQWTIENASGIAETLMNPTATNGVKARMGAVTSDTDDGWSGLLFGQNLVLGLNGLVDYDNGAFQPNYMQFEHRWDSFYASAAPIIYWRSASSTSITSGTRTVTLPTPYSATAVIEVGDAISLGGQIRQVSSKVGATLTVGNSAAANWTASTSGTLGTGVFTLTQTAANGTTTGGASVAVGGTVVTGYGTAFTKELATGGRLGLANESHVIASIASDTQLTLAYPHSTGATHQTCYTGGTRVSEWWVLLNGKRNIQLNTFVNDPETAFNALYGALSVSTPWQSAITQSGRAAVFSVTGGGPANEAYWNFESQSTTYASPGIRIAGLGTGPGGWGVGGHSVDWLIHANAEGTANAGTNALSFRDMTSNTTRLYLGATGDVGIGNTAPASKLDVTGTVTASALDSATWTGATTLEDENANSLLNFIATADAVNQITIVNGATGNAPVITSTGSDTNVGLVIGTAGTGNLELGSLGVIAMTGSVAQDVNGAASKPAFQIFGTPFAGTGTTSFPLVYINDADATASTTLNTAGTYFGVNGNGTQDLMNLLKDGTSVFKVTSTGAATGTSLALSGAGLSTLVLGNTTSTSTATPVTINSGGTFADAPVGAKAKWKMYDDGTSIFGIGISSGQFNFFCNAIGAFKFYWNDVEKANITSAGALGLSAGISATTASLTSTLGVTGASTFTGLLTANGGATVAGGIGVGAAVASTTFAAIAAATTAKSAINLASGTAPTSPNNGDIWFDGTDLKMRIGGVTKTFTLI